MAVYVDPIMTHGGSATFRWKNSCHMFADSLEELHAMAALLRFRREWFQVSRSGLPHYDLTEGKRREALRRGACEIKSSKVLTRTLDRVRAAYKQTKG